MKKGPGEQNVTIRKLLRLLVGHRFLRRGGGVQKKKGKGDRERPGVKRGKKDRRNEEENQKTRRKKR